MVPENSGSATLVSLITLFIASGGSIGDSILSINHRLQVASEGKYTNFVPASAAVWGALSRVMAVFCNVFSTSALVADVIVVKQGEVLRTEVKFFLGLS